MEVQRTPEIVVRKTALEARRGRSQSLNGSTSEPYRVYCPPSGKFLYAWKIRSASMSCDILRTFSVDSYVHSAHEPPHQKALDTMYIYMYTFKVFGGGVEIINISIAILSALIPLRRPSVRLRRRCPSLSRNTVGDLLHPTTF